MDYTEEDWALDEEGLDDFYDEDEPDWTFGEDEYDDGDYHDEDSEYHKYNTDI